jgi:enoyl-CoA hydratase/carnithine racemase
MPSVTYVRDAATDVAEVVIAKPPLNLFDRELIDDLRRAVEQAGAERPRALLVRAEGRVFTAGVDVHTFGGLTRQTADALTGELLEITHAIEDLPLPTIAVVGGICLTIGLEIALACDLLLAAEGARFGLVEKVVAITPLMGGTQRIAERAGSARAREFVMTGGQYGAAELERWGVVNRVLAPEALLDAARELARSLAAGPTLAHAATKAVVRAQADHGTRGADARTAELTSHLFETEDARGAIATFLEHGGPGHATFSGR